MNPLERQTDAELITAWLDGELDAAGSQRLQARLAKSAELRLLCDEIQSTRTLLRRTPRLPVPHHFILTRSMLPQTGLRRIFPLFSFASASAAVGLLVLFAASLLPSRAALVQMAPQPAGQSDEVSSPQVFTWGAGKAPQGLGGGPPPAAAEPSTMLEKPLEPAAAPVTSAQSDARMPPAQQPENALPLAKAAGAPPPAQMPEPTSIPPAAAVALPTSAAAYEAAPLGPTQAARAAPPPALASPTLPKNDNGPVLGVRPTGERGRVETLPAAPRPVSTRAVSQPPGWQQALLLAAAVLMGAAAWLFRRWAKR